MRADVFLDLILGKLNLGHLIIGDDFKFGANREGDFELLKSWGDSNNIIVDKTLHLRSIMRELVAQELDRCY